METMTTSTGQRPEPTRRRRRNTGLVKSICILSTLAATTIGLNLPWPCLFASAENSCFTQRITSSASQSSRAFFQSKSSQQQQQQFTTPRARVLDGQYQADDQYINEGAQANNYDDDAANEAMQARDEANEGNDDGYLNMNYVDFDQVSVMPVSCVN